MVRENEILFFGESLVRLQGQNIDFRGKWQPLNVFAFLVLHPGWWSYGKQALRPKLESELNLTESAIATALSRLRGLFKKANLDPKVFLPSRRLGDGTCQVKFNPPPDLYIDVREFTERIESNDPAEWEEAIQIYRRGDFLPEICGRGLPAGHWAVEKAEEYQGKYRDLLRRLIWPNQPPSPYQTFVGREKEIKKILKLLGFGPGEGQGRRPQFVSIEGLSGIGKTSVLYACFESLLYNDPLDLVEMGLVKKSLEELDLDKIIWVDGRLEGFRGGIFPAEGLTLERLWDAILRSFYEDLGNYKEEEKKRHRVSQLLQEHSCIIAIDNADTIPSLEGQFLPALQQALAQSKRSCVILTSRIFVSQVPESARLRLEEVPEPEAQKIFENLLNPDVTVSNEDWKKIYSKFKGHPRFLMVIAGEVNMRWSVDNILEGLEEARFAVERYRNTPHVRALEALRAGPRTVNEVAQVIGIEINRVRGWLEQAVEEGLAESRLERRNGRQMRVYELDIPLRTDPLGEIYTYLYWNLWQRLPVGSKCLLIFMGKEFNSEVFLELLQKIYEGIPKFVKVLSQFDMIKASLDKLEPFHSALDTLFRTYLVRRSTKDGMEFLDCYHESIRDFVRSELPMIWWGMSQGERKSKRKGGPQGRRKSKKR